MKIVSVLLLLYLTSRTQHNIKKAMNGTNPVLYFEIPVNDLNRAEKFYKKVFDFSFERETIDGYEMALFPFSDTQSGITGALEKGDVYKPSKNGVIIYFRTNSIDKALQNVVEQGGGDLISQNT